MVEITAVIKTKRLRLCVSLSLIWNRTDLQNYCSVQCMWFITHTHIKKEKKKTDRESTPQPPYSVSRVFASLKSQVLPPRQQLSAGGRRGGEEGRGNEGMHSSFSSNGDVITKRQRKHSPPGFFNACEQKKHIKKNPCTLLSAAVCSLKAAERDVCCADLRCSCLKKHTAALKDSKMKQDIIGCDYIWGKLRRIGMRIDISKWPAVLRRSDGPGALLSFSTSSSHFHHNIINPLLGVCMELISGW